ncbi:flavoprotein [Streptomyces sp. IpFD-1.1]|uniref:flavoprotein n=1 Tax=Streptomyces sp. IpFD-1.1 TaxID=2841664 RepID=UPI002095B3DF|nr:flavoprotein [Streptomyces sp. IpFD-1.1]MCO6748831.1 flavoprotein [Streptomyces sp. IpFD-1.1]
MTHPTRTLYLIACAAPPARRITTPIRAAQAAGWDVCLILTPAAHRWATQDADGELAALQQLTGHPVRWQYKLPSQPDALPAPDAILAAPLTSNSLHKWAAGISDTLALGLLTEALGLQPRIPIVALPHWNAAQDRHPATAGSIATLREAGVAVLHGDTGFVPHEPRRGDLDAYPWHTALAALPNRTSRPHD